MRLPRFSIKFLLVLTTLAAVLIAVIYVLKEEDEVVEDFLKTSDVELKISIRNTWELSSAAKNYPRFRKFVGKLLRHPEVYKINFERDGENRMMKVDDLKLLNSFTAVSRVSIRGCVLNEDVVTAV